MQLISYSLIRKYITSLCIITSFTEAHNRRSHHRQTCVVKPSRDGSDDSPAIVNAFERCGENGRVIFLNETYNVHKVMNTSGLSNVEVDLHGTLLWGTNISYFLNNSLPMGYQNQSTAWIFGGRNIRFRGHGYGTFDGNGQVWYDFINGRSNYPRRPHQVTFWETHDSVFEGLRFVQSQMWTMTLIHSSNTLLENIYVKSVSTNPKISTVNTDGADTIYADNITFKNWQVTNGDDGISPKANSTNISVYNSTFIGGSGLALGSIGQYDGVFETIENFTAVDCSFENTIHALYVKTWTGDRVGYPPNGGGGGIGYIKNIHVLNTTLTSVRVPFSITQCTSFSALEGNCSSSKFQVKDITIRNMYGTADEDPVALLQCSAEAPCRNIELDDTSFDIRLANGTMEKGYNCGNVVGVVGFNCTGTACNKASPDGTC